MPYYFIHAQSGFGPVHFAAQAACVKDLQKEIEKEAQKRNTVFSSDFKYEFIAKELYMNLRKWGVNKND